MICYSVWKDIPEVYCFDDECGDSEFDTAFYPKYDTEICEIINSTFSDDTTDGLHNHTYADISITRRFTAIIADIVSV